MVDIFGTDAKVYCDLCIQKIYLANFPENWDDMEDNERYAYMNKEVAEGDIGETLSEWSDNGDSDVANWTLICKRCVPK